MKELPTLPDACALDAAGQARQAERYRTVGESAELTESAPKSFTIRVAQAVDEQLVEELIGVENECCPFFQIEWEPAARVLAFAVSRDEEGPALDAIAYALGMESARRPQNRISQSG